jgi:hypothetical protein
MKLRYAAALVLILTGAHATSALATTGGLTAEAGPTIVQGTPVSPPEARSLGQTWAELLGTDSEGTRPATDAYPSASPDTPAEVCWTAVGALWHEWGTYPYQQRVYEDRTWCADRVGGHQTYRSSHVHLHSTLCSNDHPYAQRVSGGNGYTWTTVRSGGHFACQSPIPYVTFNWDDWQEWACNVWGNCSLVRFGRL